MKLWEGRFAAPTAADADKFNESLSKEKKLSVEEFPLYRINYFLSSQTLMACLMLFNVFISDPEMIFRSQC